jgi:DNA-binding PadR family transcriptional regulator
MFAYSIDSDRYGHRCGPDHVAELRAFWHEMSGRGEGPAGEGGRGRHGAHRRHHNPGHRGGIGFGGFGPGGPRGRGRKARRGDIRTAALLLLAEEPRNGYQIMQEVEERSDGVWRPSPGSVYPALAQLEDEGLIRSEETDGRKLLALTDAGRALIEQRDADQSAPWEQMSEEVSDQAYGARKLIPEIAFAFAQVMRSGSDAQLAQARKVLETARRDLYRILGDGDLEEDAGAAQDDA